MPTACVFPILKMCSGQTSLVGSYACTVTVYVYKHEKQVHVHVATYMHYIHCILHIMH